MYAFPIYSRTARALLLAAILTQMGCSPRGDKAPISSRDGSADERVRNLLNRISKDPGDADARLQLGIVHEENGHFMAALESYRAANGLKYTESAVGQGRCLNRLLRYEESIPLLEGALERDPNSAGAAIELASALAQIGKLEAARVRLRKFALQSNLEDAGAGRAPDMVSLAKAFDALSDTDSALEWSEAAIRSAPTVPDAYLISGRILLKQANSEEASKRLVKAVTLKPESAAARELFGDALAESDRGMSGALDRWLEAIELKSTRPQTYYRAAEVLKGRGETRRAAEVLMRAGVNTYDKVNAFRAAAAYWKKEGDENQTLFSQATSLAAEREFQKALLSYAELAKNPDSQWKKRGLDGVAEMYRLLNRPQQALAAAKKAAISGSASEDLRIANAYLLLGVSAPREDYLRRAMKKDPNLTGAVYSELGIIAESRKQPNEAIKLYEKAIESEPRNIEALLALSRLYLAGGRTPETRNLGVEKAAQAAAAAPNDWRAFKQLGSACSKIGGRERAKQAYQHAIDLNPRNAALYRLLAEELTELGERKAVPESIALAVKLERKSKTRIGE